MKRKVFNGVIIGVIIFVVLSALYLLGLFGTWQERLSDTLYTQKPSPENIAIIAIDDTSINQIGRFPWDRKVYADLLNKLNTQNPPKVIGFDISFLEKSDEVNDQALANAIKNLENTEVILASEYSGEKLMLPIEILNDVAISGFANITPDIDGITRKAAFWKITEDKSFAYNVIKSYPGKALPTTQGIRINYLGKPGTVKTYSYVDVLNGNIDSSIFADKIVLIGATAPNLHDDQAVPTAAKMPGVEIQANIVNTLLNDNAKVDEEAVVPFFTIFIIAIAGSIIFVFLPPVGVVIAAVILVISYILYVITSFDAGIIRNIIYPTLAIILSAVANIIYKYKTENAAKKFLRKTFSLYLSESVLNHLLENPHKIKLGGERKELTVLFSDIAGFTTISESMKPHDLAELMNKYLTKMTDIVFANDGVLDKYIGDAVMAFWGAPNEVKNHALSACITALEMQEQIAKNFDFTSRVGINSGEMVVGNMGSAQRFDYSLLGDNVNLGARLEGINKMYGTRICISQNTYDLVSDDVTARKLDTVAVKGKKTGVAIYELRHLGQADKAEKAFLDRFEKARSLYEKGEFKKALSEFKSVNKEYSDDETTKIYIDRVKELIKNPPSEWDGVYHATSK